MGAEDFAFFCQKWGGYWWVLGVTIREKVLSTVYIPPISILTKRFWMWGLGFSGRFSCGIWKIVNLSQNNIPFPSAGTRK
jgi:hypothetical protein